MGGYGSGNWGRWQDRRTTVNQVRRLDVRILHRAGFLKPGQHGVITWGRGKHHTGQVSYTMQGNALVLSYQSRDSDGPWQPVMQAITLDWTLCHYGGSRPWFLCPQCARRVAVLALGGRFFLCRQCYRLPCASQCETPLDLGYHKVRKIREKAGASPNLMAPISDKPKGMHWRTFERIRAVEREAYVQVLHQIRAKLPWAR